MSSMKLHIGILLLSVLAASVSQILLKISADRSYPSRIREYLNLHVLTGYGLLFLSTILTMIALKRVPLSWAPVIESFSYIFVSVLGFWILKEHFTKRRLLGLLVILVGILVFSL
ncbi:MAG: EamA family transporter [Eubacteriales bacterium]|nr:EamA family transporter [Eubacteriales bacterium]